MAKITLVSPAGKAAIAKGNAKANKGKGAKADAAKAQELAALNNPPAETPAPAAPTVQTDNGPVLPAGAPETADEAVTELASLNNPPAAPAPVVSAKDALAAWLAPETLVTIVLPKGTREDGRWLVAPLWKGHERWFDKTKIHGFTPIANATHNDGRHVYGTGATVTVRRAELAYRKMSHLIPNTPPADGSHTYDATNAADPAPAETVTA